MKLFIQQASGKTALASDQMSYVQTRQAAAVMDSIARLIPQEGVDYDVHVTFKGVNNPSVSMDIIALTEKGAFWRKYVSSMISKYPPKVEYDGEALPDNPSPEDFPETKEGAGDKSEETKEELDAQVVS